MPSGRNQPGRTTADQLNIRIFGYFASALTSVLFHACSFVFAQGPADSSVRVLTHSTGWPCATAIIWAMRAIMPTEDPAATLAASFVPSAKTQQPRYPCFRHALATL